VLACAYRANRNEVFGLPGYGVCFGRLVARHLNLQIGLQEPAAWELEANDRQVETQRRDKTPKLFVDWIGSSCIRITSSWDHEGVMKEHTGRIFKFRLR